MKSLILASVLTAMTPIAQADEPISDLSGDWSCALDPDDCGLSAGWADGTESFPETVRLPGTTDLSGLGPRADQAEEFGYHLTRLHAFTGPAWYAREIDVPESWRGRETELFLERVMWQSRVWVDGREAGDPKDSLCAPHVYQLGALAPGKHRLVIRVDNRMIHPIGDKGHAYGDQTQSAWNGIVGGIELRARPSHRLDLVRVFPSLDGRVRVEVSGRVGRAAGLALRCSLPGTPHAVSAPMPEPGADGRFSAVMELAVEGKVRCWSEFDPFLYQIEVSIVNGGGVADRRSLSFGFREVSHEGNRLMINGRPVFMRGNLECAVFPKTGHPPADEESWSEIWKIYQDHGLNHARFHSWCPPEAAFSAADKHGIYLQVEAPIWMDRWMAGPNERPEMETAGHPKGLGWGDRTNDAFAQAEIRRILDTYGNHPSFVFFCIGNELGTSNFDVTGQWMRDAKAYDPRHLYAASTARAITPFCEYNATHQLPGIGPVRQHVGFGTDWDYENTYARAAVPIIAHEIGQWPVYPDWEKELSSYTGPLKPYRLAACARMAEKNGLADDVAAMHAASGAANRLLYRDEIESFLRTPSCRGFQLLGMQDFTGQGEAMVGWLDPFYQNKGTTSAAEFRRYCAPTVPLLRLPAYVFRTSERPVVGALLHHYGPADLRRQALKWSLKDASGRTMDEGSLAARDFPAGGVHDAGRFSPDLGAAAAPVALELVISLADGTLPNSYRIWVFPDAVAAAPENGVLVTSDWMGAARPALAEGRKVVLLANGLGGRAAAKLAQWMPLYWSVPFFPGQSRDTLGLAIDASHPVFRSFPTGSFGDWNWFRICQGAHGFDLTDIPAPGLRPVVAPVTDFHLNRRLASLFEVRVGKGSLLVCGYDLGTGRAAELPEVAQLRRSLLDYTASNAFSPAVKMAVEALDSLFASGERPVAQLPERFRHAELYVSAARTAEPGSSPWNHKTDALLTAADGVGYSVEAEGSWTDAGGSAWFGKRIRVTVRPRMGEPGKLLVRFHDWNRLSRTGKLTFEGQSRPLGAHADGVWVEFPYIREDTNDGKLVLTAESLTGPNLMITDIALLPDD